MLKRFFVTLVTACTLTTTSLAMAATGETFVKLVTSEGNIELSLDNKKPLSQRKILFSMSKMVTIMGPLFIE